MKCQRSSPGTTSPWRTFSIRRLIIDSVSCGGAKRKSEESSNAVEMVKMKKNEELKKVVRDLQSNNREEEEAAVREVRRLTKDNADARTNLALLGAIPPLVALLLLDHDDNDTLVENSLYALLNLAIANDANKAAIVKAGAIHKMLKLIESPKPNPSIAEAIVANFLGLSASDSNKPIIGSSGAVPFLVKTLKDKTNSSAQAKQDSLRALYNLSIVPANIATILETDLVPILLSSLGDMEVSEMILSILSNIVHEPEGRKAVVSCVPDSLSILIDVLNWTDSSRCQEKASYILMVLSHKSFADRQAMIEAGIASSLLELSLLGSTLSQKRASRILECLRIDKGKQISESYGAVSAPIYGSLSSFTDSNNNLRADEECLDSEERKAVKQLVQQSLHNNMRRIVKRANLPQDFVPSDHLKSFTASSTSKSLPF